MIIPDSVDRFLLDGTSGLARLKDGEHAPLGRCVLLKNLGCLVGGRFLLLH